MVPRPGVEPGLPYGASNTKTGKFPRTDTSVSLGTFVPLVVENCGFAADSATNLPQFFDPPRGGIALHSSVSTRLLGIDERRRLVYTVHTVRVRGGGVRVGPKKAEANRRKHGIEFLDAVIVFDDDRGITLLDEHPTEERYVTFGMNAHGRVLAVSYALRGNTIRIISAREATSREQAQYEDKRI